MLGNPSDEISIKRVLNVPKRGVGDTSVGRVDAFAQARGLPFFQALEMAAEAGLSGKALNGVNAFLTMVEEFRSTDGGPGAVVEAIIERTGYKAELEAENSVESAGRLENLGELVGQAKEFTTLQEFLETVSLVANTDESDSDDESSVVLMTLHTAKGLEYPVVFLLGLEDGVFPHIRSLGEPSELEEERRLAYVGITRARQRLYITHAWCRSLFGATQYNPVSRFVGEIPEHLVTSIGDDRRRGSGYGSDSGGWGSRYGGDFGNRTNTTGSGRRWGWTDGDTDPDEPAGRVFGRGDRDETASTSSGPRGRERVVEAAMRAAKAATPATTTGAESLALKVGEDVMHAKFGEGVVLEIIGAGDKTEAVVRFPGVGEKRLLLAWTPLKRA